MVTTIDRTIPQEVSDSDVMSRAWADIEDAKERIRTVDTSTSGSAAEIERQRVRIHNAMLILPDIGY